MVYFITGDKNEGKTRKLKELFGKTDGAHGFGANKVLDCGRVTMYTLTDLRTGESFPLAKLTSLPIPNDWGRTEKHGAFTFTAKGFTTAERILQKAVEEGAKAFFIDELGKLELSGRGHANLIRSALGTGMDLYISIRTANAKAAAKTFGIEDYKTIPAS